jgi:hypothetical protein
MCPDGFRDKVSRYNRKSKLCNFDTGSHAPHGRPHDLVVRETSSLILLVPDRQCEGLAGVKAR